MELQNRLGFDRVFRVRRYKKEDSGIHYGLRLFIYHGIGDPYGLRVSIGMPGVRENVRYEPQSGDDPADFYRVILNGRECLWYVAVMSIVVEARKAGL